MRSSKRNKKPKNKKLLAGLIVLVALLFAGGFFFLESTNKINLFGNNRDDAIDKKTKTTSDAATAQEDFTGGTDRKPNTSNKNEGTVEDSQGTISSIPPQSDWTTSASGAITVYRPTKNTLLTNGYILNGKATTPRVSFRLIDDVSGVIAQGDISVVNGSFSGKFNFSTTASTGRLDIFSTQDDGVEANNVEVPIRFK